MQKNFQENTLDTDIDSMTIKEKSAFIHEHSYFLIEEVVEMLRELPYHKSWKNYDDLTDQQIKDMFYSAKKEVIDQFIFLANVMIMLDVDSEEISNLYDDKLSLNVKRQNDPSLGYIKVDKKVETPEEKMTTVPKEIRQSKDDEIILASDRVHIPYFVTTGIYNASSFKMFFDKIQAGKRGNLENNERFVQPIPYAVVKKGESIFVYERLTSSGESRLHGKKSIGVGGHMNPEESVKDFSELLKINSVRELDEELQFFDSSAQELVSVVDAVTSVSSLKQVKNIIASDKSEVDKVHIGLLQEIELKQSIGIAVKEFDSLKGHFVNRDELIKDIEENPDSYESWTKNIKDYI